MNFEILMITCGIYAKYHYKSCYYLYKLVRQPWVQMVLFLTFNQTFFLVNVINYTMQEVFFILRHHTSYNPSLYACPVGKRASSCLGSFNSNFKIVPICFSGHFCKEKCHLFKYQNYLLHLCIFKDREK